MNQEKVQDNYQPTELLQLLYEKPILSKKGFENFIAFLYSCAELLNKGEPVQAIWDDYQATIH